MNDHAEREGLIAPRHVAEGTRRFQKTTTPLWVSDPIEPDDQKIQGAAKKSSEAPQLRLYLGPELIKSA